MGHGASCDSVPHDPRDGRWKSPLPFPTYGAELVSLIVDADRNQAIYEYNVSGTHAGSLCVRDQWYSATGKPFHYTSMAVVTFDDIGLVSEVRSYFDFIDIVRQVGLAEP